MSNNPERDADIVQRYKAGEKQEQLAASFHLTRGRIQQILKAAGVTYKDSPRAPRGDRYGFVGANITTPMKEKLRDKAKRSGKSMSRVLEETLEERFAEDDEPKGKIAS